MSSPKLFGPDGISQVNTKAERAQAASFKLSSDFSLQTGRGMVKLRLPGIETVYSLLPAEARLLGMQLIVESEAAILTAAQMRMLLELVGAAPEQAVQILQAVNQGTRADHALEAERQHRQSQQDVAMEGDGGQSKPS